VLADAVVELLTRDAIPIGHSLPLR
jgi:hypothetical protein